MSTDHNRIKVADLEKNQPNKILATNSNGELEFSDINFAGSDSYNALDYTLTGKSLDARQGKVLKDLIDNINALLASDNINLSTLQNLVDALEAVQNSLNSILVNDLTTGGATKALTAEMGKNLQNNKVDKVAGKSLLTDTEIIRLGTLSNYMHPANHSPSIITQDPSNRFVTDAEKATWNAKQSNITAGTATQYFRGDKTWQTLDKTAAGLANVDNTADAAKNVLSATKLTTPRTINGTAFDGSANITINAVDTTARIASSEKGAANGVATLDASGIIPTTQLPSYVDDVLEFANLAGFPVTGEAGKIYVAKDTNKTYRWGGSSYVYITSGAVDSVSGRTGVITLTKSDVGLGSVDNTADASKNVLSATKLTTPRTINNVAFDGSANITITDSTKENNIAAGTPTQYFRGDKTWQTLDKTAAGLANVDNTADTAKNVLSATKLTTPRTINGTAFDGTANVTINAVDATARIASTEKGTANGVATLDASGIIPTTQLPSYVDDVLEFVNLAGFPATGEAGKIYVAKDTNKTYRWGGSAYVYITSGSVDSVSGRTGVVTLTKNDVGLGSVDNTADTAKNVLSATKLTTPRTINNVAFDGSANITVTDTTKIGGSGTINSFPKFITANTLGNSSIVETTTDVTLTRATTVESRLSLQSGATALSRFFFRDTDNNFGIFLNDSDGAVTKFRIRGTAGAIALNDAGVGNVLVGTAVDNITDRLQVNGNIKASGTIFTNQFLSYGNLDIVRLRPALAQTGGIWTGGNSIDTNMHHFSSGNGNFHGMLFNAYYDNSNTVFPGGVRQTNNGNAYTLGAGYFLYKGNGKLFQWGMSPTFVDGAGKDELTVMTNLMTLNSSGNLTATGGFTGSLTGNASTATTLQTARTINGISFNGSANITINAVDSTPRIASSEKGIANGVATLDASGIILTTQLPSYVDDVLEFVNLAGFPATGETGKIYVAKDTNKTYRWGGSAYVYITSGAVDSVSGKTGVITLTKSDVGLSVVDNTSDLSKPVSTAMQTALNAKQATLVSGTNIKTVNGNTLLGSGDIAVSIPSHIEYNTTDLTLWNNGKGNIATNTAFGDGALKTNSSGMQLVAVGTSSLLSNTTGYMSTAIGSESLKANTIGIYNTAVGTKALLSNTTGSQNVAIGTYALQTAIAASRNIAIGTGAMEQALSGDSNIAIGSFAISGSNTGSDNIAIGDNSLAKNTSGKDNTAVGRYSLWSNTTGIGNTGFGYNSLNSNTTGVNNVASGKYSLGFNTTGSENVAIGYRAGHFWGGGTSNPNIDSSNSIYIGSEASGLAAAGFNEIVIGAGAIGAGSNTSTVGNPWITKTILRGQVSGGSFKIDAMNSVPASATATGATGEIRFTSSAIYVCIATNTWVKSALTTW